MTQLDRMEEQLQEMNKKLDSHLERISKMEVKVSGFITIGSLVVGVIISALVKLYIGV